MNAPPAVPLRGSTLPLTLSYMHGEPPTMTGMMSRSRLPVTVLVSLNQYILPLNGKAESMLSGTV